MGDLPYHADEGLTTASVGWPPPLVAGHRNAILAMLSSLWAAGWIVFLGQTQRPMGMDAEMSMQPPVGPDLTMSGSWPLFLVMWAAMMGAMMVPAATPMVLMYARVRRDAAASVALFTGAYLGLWVGFGGLAYLLSVLVEWTAERSEWMAMNWGRAGGGLILVAGIYQLTPLKERCLHHCRTPLAFLVAHWRDGRSGAIRMGFAHGLYCLGCCWMLFIILIPLGVMNVAAMIVVSLVVFAEKVAPHGRGISLVASVALVVGGVAVVLQPSLLPTGV